MTPDHYLTPLVLMLLSLGTVIGLAIGLGVWAFRAPRDNSTHHRRAP